MIVSVKQDNGKVYFSNKDNHAPLFATFHEHFDENLSFDWMDSLIDNDELLVSIEIGDKESPCYIAHGHNDDLYVINGHPACNVPKGRVFQKGLYSRTYFDIVLLNCEVSERLMMNVDRENKLIALHDEWEPAVVMRTPTRVGQRFLHDETVRIIFWQFGDDVARTLNDIDVIAQWEKDWNTFRLIDPVTGDTLGTMPQSFSDAAECNLYEKEIAMRFVTE